MGQTTRAIGCVLVFTACGGAVTTAAPQRVASEGGSDAASSTLAAGDGGSGREAFGGVPGCRWPASLGDAGPGVRACSVGTALLQCRDDGGTSCTCVSDDPTGCPQSNPSFTCGPTDGFTCQNLCGPDEYAVACPDSPPLPPRPTADGGFAEPEFTANQDPPAGCRHTDLVPEGALVECCPCE